MKNCFDICVKKKKNMKKYGICFLFILTLPAHAAGDSCSNPAAYTIDRRCYITGAQTRQPPYNSVVQLIDDIGGYCSGTIVNFGSEQYIVTAYHCALGLDSDTVQQEIHATMPNGERITAHYHSGGGYGKDNHDINKDFAFYRIDNAPTPLVKYPGVTWRYVRDVQNMLLGLIAYGSLKIMSDAEIKDYKARYIKYLRNQHKGLTKENGVIHDGIQPSDMMLVDFLKAEGEDYYLDLFEDMDNMKISVCTMPQSYCQGWYGASGGAFFDTDGNVVAVLSNGIAVIGSKFHALITDPVVPTQAPDKKWLFQPTSTPVFQPKF